MSNSDPNDPMAQSAESKAGELEDKRIAALFEQHLPALRGFLENRASKLVLNRESADDLVQSACREAVEHWQDGRFQLRSDAEFKQWLYQAGLLKLKAKARYHLADRRDQRREVRSITPLDSEDPGIDPQISETPSRLVATQESREKVQQAIQDLPDRDRRVLTLAVLEGRSHQEVACLLNLEAAHFRMVLSRAMAKLAKRL